MASNVRFEDLKVGDEIPSQQTLVDRAQIKAYADASGDQNPLHQDDDFARSVGFPGVIAHGMFSMARLTKAVTDWLGDPGALIGMRVQFRAVVHMDETLVSRAQILSLDPATRRARLSLRAEVERDGQHVAVIKNSVAEVQLA